MHVKMQIQGSDTGRKKIFVERLRVFQQLYDITDGMLAAYLEIDRSNYCQKKNQYAGRFFAIGEMARINRFVMARSGTTLLPPPESAPVLL